MLILKQLLTFLCLFVIIIRDESLYCISSLGAIAPGGQNTMVTCSIANIIQDVVAIENQAKVLEKRIFMMLNRDGGDEFELYNDEGIYEWITSDGVWHIVKHDTKVNYVEAKCTHVKCTRASIFNTLLAEYAINAGIKNLQPEWYGCDESENSAHKAFTFCYFREFLKFIEEISAGF